MLSTSPPHLIPGTVQSRPGGERGLPPGSPMRRSTPPDFELLQGRRQQPSSTSMKGSRGLGGQPKMLLRLLPLPSDNPGSGALSPYMYMNETGEITGRLARQVKPQTCHSFFIAPKHHTSPLPVV